MPAPTTSSSATLSQNTTIQTKFLAVLPQIEAHVRFRFRSLPRDHQEECVAETIAYCWLQFRRLMQRDRDPTEFTGALVRFAVLAVQSGRSIGRPLNRKELYSMVARVPKRRIESLESQGPGQTAAWKHVLVEKRGFAPDQVAATRIDFQEWRNSLPVRSRRVADLLASGEQASVVARILQISRTRVTQLRQELAESWQAFHGEAEPKRGLEGAMA